MSYGGYIPTLLSNGMNDLKKIQSEKGVPIIIGEFGAADFNNSSERVKWARDYMSQASAAGFPCILWDNNVTTSWGRRLRRVWQKLLHAELWRLRLCERDNFGRTLFFGRYFGLGLHRL